MIYNDQKREKKEVKNNLEFKPFEAVAYSTRSNRGSNSLSGFYDPYIHVLFCDSSCSDSIHYRI